MQAQRDLQMTVSEQKKATGVWSLKADLIDLAAKLNRGVDATEEQQQQVLHKEKDVGGAAAARFEMDVCCSS